MKKPIRIGALVSGGGTNLQAIIDACKAGSIPGDVVFVGTDNPDAYGLARAKKHGIPSFVVDYRRTIARYHKAPDIFKTPEDADLEQIAEKSRLFPSGTHSYQSLAFFKTRVSAEADLLEKINAHQPVDLIVLAGFMRNLTPYFIDKINADREHPRIMNIHPALLPAFPGIDGYGDTYRYGCKIGGCTVHFIDYGEDSGPIIGQKAFEIEDTDTLETIREKGLALEWTLYVECVRLFAAGRLRLVQRSFTATGGAKLKRTVVERLKDPNH